MSGVALLAAFPAAAQQIELETISVEGEAARPETATGPVNGYVGSQTVSGSKTVTPLIEVPQSISVVTRDQMEDRGVQNIAEALNYTAGVVTQPYGNDPRYFNPYLRGFDSVNSVYFNHFRFIRDFGALAFEPYGLERVEVVRGPASVLYGSGEPGGLINLIQKRPTGTSFGEVGGEIGNHNRFVAKLDAGGVVNDTVSYRITSLGRLSDHQMDYVEDNRFYIAPAITFAPTADTSLTLLATLQRDTGTSPLGLPQAGTLDPNPNGRIPRSRYIGEPDFNDNESTLATIGYEFRHRFNETFEFRQNAQYLSFDADYNNLFFFGMAADQRTVTRGPSVQSETIDSFAVDNQLQADFATGALDHTVLFGLDYRHHNQWRSSNFSGTYSTIDVFNPVYGTPIVVDPSGANISDVTLQQTGLYVQDQVKIDRLSLTFGLRQDWVTNEDELTGVDQDDDALTGRAGVSYLFDNGLAPYVSYATSFNPVVGTTTAGDLYKPSEGEQIEAGIKFQPPGWNSFVTASVFDLTKTNIVSEEAVPDGGGGLVQERTQVGEIQSRGFEIEGTASLGNGFSLIASYAYTDAEITRGDDTVAGGVVTGTTTGNRPANVPEHMASLWLNYELQSGSFQGLSFGAGVRYLGERFGNNSNTILLPSATVFDAAIRYERDDFEVSLNINNIADDDYVASCNFGCFYGEGRTVLGSVKYKW